MRVSEIMNRYSNATPEYSVLAVANVSHDSVYLEVSVYSNSVSVYMNMYEIVVKFNGSHFTQRSDNSRMFDIFNEIFDMIYPVVFSEDLNETLMYVNGFHELFTHTIEESLKIATTTYADINDLAPPVA
jgi:hypothetical protein